MSVITLIIILAFLAGLGWLVNTKITHSTVKWWANLALIVIAAITVLDALGIWEKVKDFKVPKL